MNHKILDSDFSLDYSFEKEMKYYSKKKSVFKS